MESSVDTLRNNVNQLKTRFDKLRDDVISKLNECSECIQTAEKLCQEATEMTTNLENKLANASNEEKEWKDIKLKLATTSIKGKVILDVGGERYATSIDTLTREKNTLFTALFSKQWELERDPDDKSIFIDRDGKLFNHILAYLRTVKVPNDTMNNEPLRHLLITEGEYFRLHNLIDILTEPERKRQKEKEEELRVEMTFPNGTLLQPEQKIKLNEFYGKSDQRWELIYKASRDGFDVNAFHTRCDNKGSTMTIVRSNNNYLFGGYTAIPWTSVGGWKSDTTAFLLTLINPHNITPTKYLINPTKAQNTVYHDSNYMSRFGASGDINLVNNSNANNSSCTDFPSSFIDTTGHGNNTFTGAKNFTTSDIEVYKLA